MTKAIEILLVEDNPADVRLMVEAFKDAKVPNRLTVASDGGEALEILSRTDAHADVRRPDLVLLDLNLPRVDGREVLERMKGDPDLRRIPVVVLTSSADEHDVQRCYDLHANCYITKPVDLEQFLTIIKTIEDFWLTIVRLPS